MAKLDFDKTKTAVIASELSKGNYAGSKPAQDKDLIGNARRVMDAARANGIPVIHVTIGFREGFPEVSERNKLFRMIKQNGLLRAGTEHVAFHETTAPLPNEVVVNRPRVNPFYNSELETILKAHNVETIFVMGMITNFSVETTVRHAADLDYQVFLLEDCCASPNKEHHDWAVQNVISRVADIATSADFVESLQ